MALELSKRLQWQQGCTGTNASLAWALRVTFSGFYQKGCQPKGEGQRKMMAPSLLVEHLRRVLNAALAEAQWPSRNDARR
jgi:hypothetical protein